MTDQRFSVTRDGKSVRVVVPLPTLLERLHQQRSNAFLTTEVFLERLLFQQETHPRALFELDAEWFRMTLVATDLGERIEVVWPRNKIIALRKNRYGPGLWLSVQGVVMQTYLEDLDDDLIEALSAELFKIVKQFNEPVSVVKSACDKDVSDT